MADSKITALTALTAADPVNDMFPVVDVSDTTMAASGTTKRISVNNILSSSPTASGALTVTGLVTAGSATISGDLTVDTSTLKVDSTNNRVGVATTTPGCRVDIVSDSNTSLAPVLRVNSNNVAVNTALAYDGLVGSSALTIQSGTSQALVFNTNGANESGRITVAGAYVLKGGTTTANGVGVAFPATQVASSDANCLDDYEEGTWVPTLTFATPGTLAVTYSTQTGNYIKVGNLVTARYSILIVPAALVKGTASGGLQITGLPFATSGTGTQYVDLAANITDITSGTLAISYPSASIIYFEQTQVSGTRIIRSSAAVDASNFAATNTGYISLNVVLTYTV